MGIFKVLFLASIIVFLPQNLSAEIILTNTFEEGKYTHLYRQYQEKQCSQNTDYLNHSLFKFVTSPVRGGKLAMRHQVKNCDERSEVGISHGFFQENHEYWIGWSYFIPQDFIKPVVGQPDYTIVQQMLYQSSFRDQHNGVTLFDCNQKSTKKGKLITKGVPGSYMTISPLGNLFDYHVNFYQGRDSQGRYIFGCKKISIPARHNQWEDFVMNIKPSSDSGQGFVKIWKNGKLYVNEEVALLRPGVQSMGAWKMGVYVGNPGHGDRLLYTDELRVGNANASFAAVSPPNN